MPSSSSSSDYGRSAERIAAWLLRLQGFRIVGRNVRVGGREVDLIARRGRLLVVCEVKTRSGLDYGAPLEAITTVKAARLRRLAARWAEQHGVRADGIRIDAIGLVGDGHGGFAIDHIREVC